MHKSTCTITTYECTHTSLKPHQDMEHFHYPNPCPQHPEASTVLFFSPYIYFPYSRNPSNGIKQYTLFGKWLLSLSIMFLRFILWLYHSVIPMS